MRKFFKLDEFSLVDLSEVQYFRMWFSKPNVFVIGEEPKTTWFLAVKLKNCSEIASHKEFSSQEEVAAFIEKVLL